MSPDHATSAIAIALQLEMGKWNGNHCGMVWKTEKLNDKLSLDRTSHLSM